MPKIVLGLRVHFSSLLTDGDRCKREPSATKYFTYPEIYTFLNTLGSLQDHTGYHTCNQMLEGIEKDKAKKHLYTLEKSAQEIKFFSKNYYCRLL